MNAQSSFRNPWPRILLGGFLLVCTVWAGCSRAKDESRVVARFAGEAVTDIEFMQKLDSLPRSLRTAALVNRRQFVEDIVNERFLLKEAEKRGVDKLSDVRDLLGAARKKILVAKLVETEVDRSLALEPDEAERYYTERREDFTTPVLLRASHILVKSEDEARSIREELAGGADFEETARRRSLDTTAIRGGDLGYFQRGQLVPEVVDVAYSLKKSELSDVFRTQFGWHVMKLTDRVEPIQREFRAVRNLIEERLLNEKRSKAYKALVAKVRGDAKVEIDDQTLDAVVSAAKPLDRPAPAGQGKAS